MVISRVYQPVSLKEELVLRLDERASHHVARVLRAKVDDKLILFNGKGGEFESIITHIDKKGVEVKVQQFKEKDAELSCDLYLAQGIARGEKMDFIIQKAVELGVKKIIPLITERCNVRLDKTREAKRMAHWQAIVISACEQCGRNQLPEILPPISLEKWLEKVKVEVGFVLSPHVENHFSLEILKQKKSCAIIIGPEGGLSDAEENFAVNQGFLPFNLGPRILRTETAGLAALAILGFFVS